MAACPPRPSRVGTARRFRESVDALERRVARLGDPGAEALLSKVRGLRETSEKLEASAQRQALAYADVRTRERGLRSR